MARLFEKHGFLSRELQIQGYADGKPAVSERDASGRLIPANLAKNRRVVIKVNLGEEVKETRGSVKPGRSLALEE